MWGLGFRIQGSLVLDSFLMGRVPTALYEVLTPEFEFLMPSTERLFYAKQDTLRAHGAVDGAVGQRSPRSRSQRLRINATPVQLHRWTWSLAHERYRGHCVLNCGPGSGLS